MKIGIVGLPNVGKSSLFNALTKASVPSENYPFCTIEPNIGIVAVPDERLYKLQKIYNAKKITPAYIEFVDIAGLVKGASKGEGLGNKFLSHIREVDAIVHVVRFFENKEIIHVENSIDPIRDIETINLELILADIETVQKRIEKVEKKIRATSDKKTKEEYELLKKMLEHLSTQRLAKSFNYHNEEEKEIIKDCFLLTNKPMIYVLNISEEMLSENLSENEVYKKIVEIAHKEHSEVLPICIKIEEELANLSEEEKKEFLKMYNMNESALNILIKKAYKLLGLFSFLTAGEKEVRAWDIPYGTKAPQAAGKIHSDFEKGFIRAEVVDYHDLIKYGSINAVKEAGKLRIEGKDYIVQEDDVILFRFNV